MNNRPGVMLYFSILPALDSLSPTSAGTLLLAAMHYAQDGREPIFEDGTLSFAWSFLKPSIDRDGDVYEEKRLRGSWMTYCRQCKREGNEPLDFETWRQRSVTEPLHTETDTTPISMSDPLSNSMSVSDSVSNKNIADKPPAHERNLFPRHWRKFGNTVMNAKTVLMPSTFLIITKPGAGNTTAGKHLKTGGRQFGHGSVTAIASPSRATVTGCGQARTMKPGQTFSEVVTNVCRCTQTGDENTRKPRRLHKGRNSALWALW